MQYHLALAPEFEISAADFAAVWNADPESRKRGELRQCSCLSFPLACEGNKGGGHFCRVLSAGTHACLRRQARDKNQKRTPDSLVR